MGLIPGQTGTQKLWKSSSETEACCNDKEEPVEGQGQKFRLDVRDKKAMEENYRGEWHSSCENTRSVQRYILN